MNNSPIISGNRKSFVLTRIWFDIGTNLLRKYPRPTDFYKVIKQVIGLKNRFTNDSHINKLAFVDGRYFYNINSTGWPAKHFHRSLDIEAKIATQQQLSHLEKIRMVLIGLTKKCPLNCEHCYESEELNKRETLTLNDHIQIIKKFQEVGISQFQFGGGEPLVRIHDLVEILKSAKKTSDFWISTSGFNLTDENARQLKQVGLTGVAISLDHFEPEQHNLFRRYNEAFSCVLEAAKNAQKAGLVIAFSICVTKSFCTRENLLRYIMLAKNLGASFIQLLEPRAVGNYAGKDVSLHTEHEKILEDFYFEMNNHPDFKEMPIVVYHGYRQRKIGCAGAGSRYLYVDTDGYMNSCPFCRNKTTHVLGEKVEESIAGMKAIGCAKFELLN